MLHDNVAFVWHSQCALSVATPHALCHIVDESVDGRVVEQQRSRKIHAREFLKKRLNWSHQQLMGRDDRRSQGTATSRGKSPTNWLELLFSTCVLGQNPTGRLLVDGHSHTSCKALRALTSSLRNSTIDLTPLHSDSDCQSPAGAKLDVIRRSTVI